MHRLLTTDAIFDESAGTSVLDPVTLPAEVRPLHAGTVCHNHASAIRPHSRRTAEVLSQRVTAHGRFNVEAIDEQVFVNRPANHKSGRSRLRLDIDESVLWTLQKVFYGGLISSVKMSSVNALAIARSGPQLFVRKRGRLDDPIDVFG